MYEIVDERKDDARELALMRFEPLRRREGRVGAD